jgi:hypothetical protein
MSATASAPAPSQGLSAAAVSLLRDTCQHEGFEALRQAPVVALHLVALPLMLLALVLAAARLQHVGASTAASSLLGTVCGAVDAVVTVSGLSRFRSAGGASSAGDAGETASVGDLVGVQAGDGLVALATALKHALGISGGAEVDWAAFALIHVLWQLACTAISFTVWHGAAMLYWHYLAASLSLPSAVRRVPAPAAKSATLPAAPGSLVAASGLGEGAKT